MTGQTFLYSLRGTSSGWRRYQSGSQNAFWSGVWQHQGVLLASSLSQLQLFLPPRQCVVSTVYKNSKLRACRVCISYSTAYKEPRARPHSKFVHLRITGGFWLINIASQFLSPKPHFRSGEPVCDHQGWAQPARTLLQAFFGLLLFLKARSPVWAL